MFKRSNLVAKYRNYMKFQKPLQNKWTQNLSKCNEKTESLANNIKKFVSNTKFLSNRNETVKALGVLQNKLNDKYQSTKRSLTIKQKSHSKNGFALGAVGLFKSDPITVTGYSPYDIEVLKQLGVFGANPHASVTNANTLEASESNLEASESNLEAKNNLEASESNFETSGTNLDASVALKTNNFPENENSQNYDSLSNSNLASNDSMTNDTSIFPSLYESKPFTSVLDSLPEERNDLYTTFTRFLSGTKEQSTQVESHELNEVVDLTETVFVENAKNESDFANNESDFFVIESPAKESLISKSNIANKETTNGLEDTNLVVADKTNESVGNETNNNLHLDPVDSKIVVEPIPEPPEAPDLLAELASTINALGEPTFQSLGLGGWSPVGLVQTCFEYLHVSLGIPWWEAIVIGTLFIRLAMFPLVIIAQRNAARMNNYLPQMQVLQLKMTEARQCGNQIESARYSQELMTFMREKNVNPFKNMLVPLAQMPVFVSFFIGLRGMANLPVESLRTGGLFWFNDLTVPDQFFALPVITSLTLWATIELGTDSAKLSAQNLQTMKYVLRAMPWLILPFTVNFPGAILCYWVSSNFISLVQVGFLQIPSVRSYFRIDPLIKHDPEQLPIKNKGFVGGIKDSWTNIKITQELEERRRLDELQFQRAGKGPLVKTYKYDPTKQGPTKSETKSSTANAINAKSR